MKKISTLLCATSLSVAALAQVTPESVAGTYDVMGYKTDWSTFENVDCPSTMTFEVIDGQLYVSKIAYYDFEFAINAKVDIEGDKLTVHAVNEEETCYLSFCGWDNDNWGSKDLAYMTVQDDGSIKLDDEFSFYYIDYSSFDEYEIGWLSGVVATKQGGEVVNIRELSTISQHAAYDLQGRRTEGRGLQVRDGKLMLVK